MNDLNWSRLEKKRLMEFLVVAEKEVEEFEKEQRRIPIELDPQLPLKKKVVIDLERQNQPATIIEL